MLLLMVRGMQEPGDRRSLYRFLRADGKTSDFLNEWPMPEELEKAIRGLPREREVIDFFKKLSSAEPLPTR